MTDWPTVACTGHRAQHLTPDQRDWAQAAMGHTVTWLRRHHRLRTGICGMAQGADLWWAQALLDQGVPVWAHIPFPQQPDRWPQTVQQHWRQVLEQADRVTVYGLHYSVHWFHERNRGMLDHCDALVALLDPNRHTGGTVGAVQYARVLGRPILHLDPAARTARLL